MTDPNLDFIIAAYVLGFIVVTAMVALILYDGISLKRALAKVSARGDSGTDS